MTNTSVPGYSGRSASTYPVTEPGAPPMMMLVLSDPDGHSFTVALPPGSASLLGQALLNGALSLGAAQNRWDAELVREAL